LNRDSNNREAQRITDIAMRFITKLQESIAPFEEWQTAKENYADTRRDILIYIRELAKARRARNQNRIERYSDLLNRARQSLSRRRDIMNEKWILFSMKIEEAIEIATELEDAREQIEGIPA